MRRVFWCAVAAAAFVGWGGASCAMAATLLDDGFDAESVPAGGWVMNDTAFTNFTVMGGTVDLLAPGNPFGLSGSGTNSSGNFVDLDGSTDHGGFLATNQTYAFDAGDTVTLSVDVAGNGRGGADDSLFLGFRLMGTPSITDVTASSPFSVNQSSAMLSGMATVAADAPFQIYTISFKALSAGSLMGFVGTTSMDNVGPLVDRFTLQDQLAIALPEPTAWAFLIAGFGGVGALKRQVRRRRAVAG